MNVADFFASARQAAPDRPFLIHTVDDSTYTYAQAGDLIERAAGAWHHLGVRHGDRAAFVVDNTPTFVWAWLGLARVGAVLVAVNTAFRAAEAGYVVRDCGAGVVLAEPAYAGVLPDALTTDDFTELMSAGHPAPETGVAGDDVISLIYTSGTTGDPKGVMQTHRNYVLTGQAYTHWMRMADGDRVYACLPLFHINSQAYSTMAAIASRGTLVLAPRFSASRFWPDVRRHRVTVFNFIGAMAMILAKKEPDPTDSDNEVRVAYGVPALDAATVAEIEQRFGLRVISGFGMSETTFGLLEPLDQPRRPGSMGVERHHPDPAVPRTRARIVDEHGREVERGVTGELVLRNAAMMLGYYGDPERTAAALRDGWLHTGDSAYQDADGFFYFVDRLKDIVRRRGENVSSLEVERTIARHDAVAEAAVIGVPAELSDEELMVFVVPRRRLTPEDVFGWAEDHLAPFKVPTYLRFVDSLPKTATAKVRKELLRADDARDPTLRVVRPHRVRKGDMDTRSAPATAESHGIDLVGYHDLDGDPAFKLAMQHANDRYYLYLSHFWRSAWSVVDVTDPRHPELVRTIDGPPNTWTLQVQVADGLMLTALERATPGWGFDPELTEKVGVLLWDVATDPAHPKQVAHYDTTGRGTHRNYYAGGRYAYLAAQPEGYQGNILLVLDVADPARPTEAGRWWWPGQWHGGGERPEYDHYLHGPAYVVGDLAYLSYGRVGMVVLDVSDPTRPTLVSRLSFGDFGSALGCHSAIPYGPGVVVANSEALLEGDTESLGYTVLVDVSDPAKPRVQSWLPTPYPSERTGLVSYAQKGARHGPHNQHQWQYQDCLLHDDDHVYLTHFNGGLRVYDISTPLRPREVAYYVPADPTVRRGVKPTSALITQFEDVLVDHRGYVYCTDKNHGLFVLRMAD